MNVSISRRSLLGGAVAAAAVGVAAPAFALDPVAIGAIKLDLFPLRDNGSGVMADWVQAQLPGLLHDSFARYFTGGRGGATLYVRIHQITISTGSSLSPRGGIFAPIIGGDDIIDGDVWLVDAHGRELARGYNLALSPGWNDGIGNLELTQRRVAKLCQQFAYWAPGKVGL